MTKSYQLENEKKSTREKDVRIVAVILLSTVNLYIYIYSSVVKEKSCFYDENAKRRPDQI